MAGHPILKPRKYPTGIPVQAPPGWRPPLPPPAPARQASPFRAEVGLILRTMALSLLVIVCMGVGWLLVNGRPSTTEKQAAVTPKKDRGKVEPPSTQDVEPPPEKPKPQGQPQKEMPPPSVLTYEKDVLPIVERSCLNCHGSRKRSGKLDLRTYAALVKGGEGGTGVIPGNPDKSPLYETVASGQMPPGKAKLTAKEKETIRAWIAGGAKGSQ